MTTYSDIVKWVKQEYGFTAQGCWIAHCKELNGLPLRGDPNRRRSEGVKPCPPEKRPAIEAAFRHFGLLPR